MKTINISLPDSMGDYIEETVAKEGYDNLSAYFQELVRQDRERRAHDRLENLLLEGLDSGTATPMTQQDWQDIRSAVRDRLKTDEQG